MAKATNTTPGTGGKGNDKPNIDTAQDALKAGAIKSSDTDAPGTDKGQDAGNEPAPPPDSNAGNAAAPEATATQALAVDAPVPLFIIFPGMEVTHPFICNAAENEEVRNICGMVVGRWNELNPVPVAEVPTGEDIEKTAAYLADNPEKIKEGETLIARAKEIIAQRNQPAAKTTAELETEAYDRIVRKYGKDFVTANRGTSQKYFTRTQWVGMGKNKQGWVEVPPTLSQG